MKPLRGKGTRYHSEAKVLELRTLVLLLQEEGRKMGHRGTCCSTVLGSREEAGLCTFENFNLKLLSLFQQPS